MVVDQTGSGINAEPMGAGKAYGVRRQRTLGFLGVPVPSTEVR